MTSPTEYVQLMISVLPESLQLNQKVKQRWIVGLTRYLEHRNVLNNEGKYQLFNYDTMRFSPIFTNSMKGIIFSSKLNNLYLQNGNIDLNSKREYFDKRVDIFRKLVNTYDYYLQSDMKKDFGTIAALFTWATDDSLLINKAHEIAETLSKDKDHYYSIYNDKLEPYNKLDFYADKNKEYVVDPDIHRMEEWNLVIRAIIELYNSINDVSKFVKQTDTFAQLEKITSSKEGQLFEKAITHMCWWADYSNLNSVKDMVCRIWNFQNIPDNTSNIFDFDTMNWETTSSNRKTITNTINTYQIRSDDDDLIFNSELMLKIIEFYPSLLETSLLTPETVIRILLFNGEYDPLGLTDEPLNIKLSKAVSIYKDIYENGAKGFDLSSNQVSDVTVLNKDIFVTGKIASYDESESWYYNRLISTVEEILGPMRKIIVRSFPEISEMPLIKVSTPLLRV
jgi:hypothetical protein